MDGIIEDLLIYLGDSSIDKELLKRIVSGVQSRLQVLLGVDEVPKELEYIVTEVSIIRFNRVGSEGYSSHNVEGESISMNSSGDFSEFMDEIEAWKFANQAQGNSKRKRVRFL